MFEDNTSSPLNYRYSIDWLKDPNPERKIRVWIQKLKSITMLGQPSNKADLLMPLHNEFSSTDRSINILKNDYNLSFNEDILTSQQLTKLTNSIQAVSLANVLEGHNTQRCVIDKKKFACRHGCQFFAADLKSGCDDLPSRHLCAAGKHRQLPATHRAPQYHALPYSPGRELGPHAFTGTHAGSAAKRERYALFVHRVGPQTELRRVLPSQRRPRSTIHRAEKSFNDTRIFAPYFEG
jgi:hypothetical protein